jgi:segregation and condensation protein B
MNERSDMEAAIEAVLFVSSEPVPRARLLEMFDEEDREGAAEALEAVLARYQNGDGRGVMAEDVAGGVRIATRPEMVTWLRRFFDVSGGTKLSMAALETLAIIAYRQPVTRAEIEAVRGVAVAKGTLDLLLEQGWIAPRGRRDAPGRPVTWVTTEDFLDQFGLASLDDLPRPDELESSSLLEVGTRA